MPSRIDEAGHTKAFDYPVMAGALRGKPKCSVPRVGKVCVHYDTFYTE